MRYGAATVRGWFGCSNTRQCDSRAPRPQWLTDAHRGSWGPTQPRMGRDQCHTRRRRWRKMLRCRRPEFRRYGNRGNRRRCRLDAPRRLWGQTLLSKEQCRCHTRMSCRPTLRCYRPGFRPRGNRGSQRISTRGAAEDQRRKGTEFAFATPGDDAGSETCNLRGVMPNSPPRSLR
jgi:hypothetical protein